MHKKLQLLYSGAPFSSHRLRYKYGKNQCEEHKWYIDYIQLCSTTKIIPVYRHKLQFPVKRRHHAWPDK